MNIILFEQHEIGLPLPRADRRAAHLLDVLRRDPGDTFDAGLINGARGKGTLVAIEKDALELSFAWDDGLPPPLDPIALILGLPRPQTARKVLQEATALGVSTIDFVVTEKGEASYARSTLWTSGEWRRHVMAGAEQAFSTLLPRISAGRKLADVIESVRNGGSRLALDNYEACERLGETPVVAPAVLAIGPERGWSPSERELLVRERFKFVHLGQRVLRVETACVAAVALVRSRLGLM